MQSSTVFVVSDLLPQLDILARLFKQAQLKVTTYASADALFESFDPACPGCLVADLSGQGVSWAGLHSRLLQLQAFIPLIVLVRPGDLGTAKDALKNGALDVFEAPLDNGALLKAVRHAVELDAVNRRVLHVRAEVMRRLDQLTKREREVMDSMLEGKTCKEIAGLLSMSVRTAEYHRARVMKKMGVATVVELTRLAMRVFGCHCIHKHRYQSNMCVAGTSPDPFLGVPALA